MNAGTRVIGYVRISRESDTLAGLAAQRAAIERECAHRGWELVDVVEEIASGATVKRRPQLQMVLDRLKRGEADAVVVSKLDRLARSVVDFATMLEQARRRGYKLVVLDLGIDMLSPHGEMIASVLAALAQWERRMISERTKEGLAARRAAGVTLGRPRRIDPQTRRAIVYRWKRGASFSEIARGLNALCEPTVTGVPWSRQVVRKVCLAWDREKSAAPH